MSQKEKVCLVGSGNWGSAIAKIIGKNAADQPDQFETNINMWVYEELIDGVKLTEIINTQHENVKYLPNHKLPENIIAVPDIKEAVKGATLLIFVIPHQFIERTVMTIKDCVEKNARAITLTKGVLFKDKKLVLISQMITEVLGIEVCSLMGANVANEVAKEEFCETTIGYVNEETGKVFYNLFNTPNFEVTIIPDVIGPELCGALKNIVAIGAGFCDGLGLGGNTKAAIMRIGLMEIKKFAQKFFENVKSETFFESCGVGDLITTCYGGRNRRCAEHFVKTGKEWEEIETELLKGQKIQGTLAAIEVYEILKEEGILEEFPLFVTIYKIVKRELQPKDIIGYKHVKI
jgi:glycerol-3-phosphate dehydrogenase (NAD+)